jgi:2-haloacid dehalogenase
MMFLIYLGDHMKQQLSQSELAAQGEKLERLSVQYLQDKNWDALGAKWFGFDVFWVNRLGHPFEEIGEKPNYEGNSLSKVLEVL